MSEEGVVTSVGSRSVRVWLAEHGDLRATLRGTMWENDRNETRPVAVGDRVEVTVEDDNAVIESVSPRRNAFARPQAAGHFSGRSRKRYGRQAPVQVIAANLDLILVVAALTDPPFRAGLVDRFFVAAAAQGIEAGLVLNKVDLPGDRGVAQPWRRAGHTVFETSAETGEGVDALRDTMAHQITLLVGHSGVGKSSLLNAIDPALRLGVGRVAAHHGRGRHTTTRVSLLELHVGGYVVDTPGIRELALAEVSPAELARLYPGFGELPHHCRFSNCRHRDEPDCAVRAATEAGELDPERRDTYLRILTDVETGAK